MKLPKWLRPRGPIRERVQKAMHLVFRRTGHRAGLVIIGYALRDALVNECAPVAFYGMGVSGQGSVTDQIIGQYLNATVEFVNWTDDFLVLPKGWGRQFFRGPGI